MFGVHLANAEEQENQVHWVIAKEVYQTRQVDVQLKRMHSRETCEWKWDENDFCKKRKEKRNSQGKDPRTFDENRQGGDLGTLERNSQGEDPRTLKENSQGGDLGTLEANSQRKDPRTFRNPVDVLRVQEKQKEEKWKKRKNKMVKKKNVKK